MKEINGELTAAGLKIALVASRFNSFLVEQLVKGAVDAFTRLGGDEADLTLVRVPGAYELPVVAKKLAMGGVDAVVCLGAVVQGATAHADLINQATAKAFSEISIATGVPVLDGVVAAENLLWNPLGIKRPLFKLIGKYSTPYAQCHPKSIAPFEAIDVTNDKHAEWLNPASGEPHFESVDCAVRYFHKITDVRSTHEAIDTIIINNSSVTYDSSVKHLYIHFKK